MAYKADGLDAAVVGIVRRCGQPDIICYDYQQCVEILMDRDRLSPVEAMEWMDFNVVGAWVGDMTPAWLFRATLDEIEQEME